MRQHAVIQGISSELFTTASASFSRLLQASIDSSSVQHLISLSDADAHDALLTCFLDYCVDRHSDRMDITQREALSLSLHTLDLRHPHTWYPLARSMPRRVIYHAGPTNSGKTYNALRAMSAAPSGVYCGPLRLLAMEVFDACNREGTYCSLITGQERREVPGASHVACTVEMCALAQRVDVAVIDEIQMVGDAERGFAWTRALLGVPATEVHVCGDASAVDLVRWMCQEMGEEFEVRTYERFTPLNVEKKSLAKRSYKFSVQPGDCIVAFSRADIYAIKAAVEKHSDLKACVVYGALPPETRRQQARLFNEPDNDYKVMVASDAVGMGLNLNIRRVVFHTLKKKEGRPKPRWVAVSSSAIRQIAGRAGRRSSQFLHGLVTCRHPKDVQTLRAALSGPANVDVNATPRAGLTPEFEHFERFAQGCPANTSFVDLLLSFSDQAVLHGQYFFCRRDAIVAAATMLQDIPGLSLRDMYCFAMAPASSSDLKSMAALLHWARRYAAGQPSALMLNLPDAVPTSPDEMRALESAHAVLTVWLWLSYRFEDPELFPDRERVEALGERICGLLAAGLEGMTISGIDKPYPVIGRNKRGGGKPKKYGAGLFETFEAEHRELSGAWRGSANSSTKKRQSSPKSPPSVRVGRKTSQRP